ncbi:ABC transporter permease [Caproiciproducens sp. MSJ-32]|uniref:ABC transporter permease n=1 Tax=Caproiciproducens sp. MSJ-32 TaxID=2841527 RepID=UPI001C108CCB|nr:ABC transporter permease [Caproiciproducens sp. MSJ-32]MBU5455235.1 ABC transporter permease [Caproiciproducens sp. MSJ-32]
MSLINLIKTCVYSLKSHKLRVFLTMIGIIIGISSVVTILSIGNGLKVEVNKSAQDTNANKINIYYVDENTNIDTNLIEPFNKIDINSVEKIDGVQKVERSQGGFDGMDFTTVEAEYFNRKAMIFLDSYVDNKLGILYGRTFRKDEEGKNLIVLTFEASKKLFDSPKESIGRGITINGINYEVIGVMEESSRFSLSGNVSYILKSAFSEMNIDTPIDSIDIYIKPNSNKDIIIENVKKELKVNHMELKGEYKVQDPQEITKAFEKIIGGLTTFIAFVTGISLFVGGIGVMNIMYVSVSERKREIGIRRAIGAKPRSILLQFLFEAILVTGAGGLIGILMGYLFGKVAGIFMPFSPVLTLGSFIGATLTSVMVGIIFGIIPAYNASKLEPIKAIYK